MYEFIAQNITLAQVFGTLGVLMIGMLGGGFIVNYSRGTPGSKRKMRHDLTVTKLVNFEVGAEARKVPVFRIAFRNAMGHEVFHGYATDVEIARTYIGKIVDGGKATVTLHEGWWLTDGVVTATEPLKMLHLVERYAEGT